MWRLQSLVVLTQVPFYDGIKGGDLCRNPWFRGQLELHFGTISVNPLMVRDGRSGRRALPKSAPLAEVGPECVWLARSNASRHMAMPI